MNDSTNATVHIPFNCFQLPITHGNNTFCGNLSRWQPRYSQVELIFMAGFPSFVSLLIGFVILYRYRSNIDKLYKESVIISKTLFDIRADKRINLERLKNFILADCQRNRRNGCRAPIIGGSFSTEEGDGMDGIDEVKKPYKVDTYDSSISYRIYGELYDYGDELGCIQRAVIWICKKAGKPELPRWVFSILKSFVSIKFSLYLKLGLATIDVILDCYLFYQLESGHIFDDVVHRNVPVSNAIYAFAYIGILNNLCVFLLLFSTFDASEVKDLLTIAAFHSSVAAEIILEYFYVDKYLTKTTEWYVLLKNSFFLVLGLWAIFDCLMKLKGPSIFCLKAIYIVILMIGVAGVCRLAGSVYQFSTGKIRRDCFAVDDHKIYQSPFDAGCLRGVDYTVLVLVVIPLSFAPITLAIAIQGIYSYYKGTAYRIKGIQIYVPPEE